MKGEDMKKQIDTQRLIRNKQVTVREVISILISVLICVSMIGCSALGDGEAIDELQNRDFEREVLPEDREPEDIEKKTEEIQTPYEYFINFVVEDCIDSFSDEDKMTVLKYSDDSYFRHFVLGLKIRNQYIHGSWDNSFYPYEPDVLSGIIVDRIIERLITDM